ncbi:EpsG family protein [Chryseobacterium ginsengisoli]|uniref:EpsG family protein n=1 Tax=Chryseobacterium ginsengisoli TaxID=363853 RepID=UPI003CD0871A
MILLFVFLLLNLAFVSNKLLFTNRTIIFIIGLVCWWFLESFRWESGTDFYNYYNNFNGLQIDHIRTDRFELGYNLLVLFCRDYLHFTFYIFNSVYYGIIFLLYFFSVKKVIQEPILFLFIFFCFIVGLMGSTRQLMAISIMFFATIYFLEKKKLWFIVCIVLAAFFHRTIIVCLIFILFTHNIRYKYWLYLIIFAGIAQISGLNSFIIGKTILILPESFSQRFSSYLSMLGNESINLKTYSCGIFRRVLPIVLLFIYKDKLNKFVENNILQYILNILFFSLFAYIILSFNFTFIISRISIYFNIFEALFYGWLISMFIKEKKYIYVFGLVLFFLLLGAKYIMSYPQLFIPYKTIFFTL